jgi:hypothetical protein
MRVRAAVEVEADLAALKRAAERAGTALACLFSSSDEFEAEVIRARRAHSHHAWQATRSPWRVLALVATLSLVFLMM